MEKLFEINLVILRMLAHKIKKDGGDFSKFDLFAPSVALTFKGQRQFKTQFGGVTSVICYILVFLIMILKT